MAYTRYIRGHDDLIENATSVIDPSKTNTKMISMMSVNKILRYQVKETRSSQTGIL